jgi:hypothetical protein
MAQLFSGAMRGNNRINLVRRVRFLSFCVVVHVFKPSSAYQVKLVFEERDHSHYINRTHFSKPPEQVDHREQSSAATMLNDSAWYRT